MGKEWKVDGKTMEEQKKKVNASPEGHWELLSSPIVGRILKDSEGHWELLSSPIVGIWGILWAAEGQDDAEDDAADVDDADVDDVDDDGGEEGGEEEEGEGGHAQRKF